MKRFDLEEYLKNPDQLVVARDGRSVEILKTDYENGDMIVLYNNDTIGKVTPNGMLWKNLYGDCGTGLSENPGDIFFADSDEELTDFEKRLKEIIVVYRQGPIDNETVRMYADELFELAKKEIPGFGPKK